MGLPDDVAEVEAANARFYRAFEDLDLEEMERVWAKGDHVKCIHPGWGLLEGWETVRASWEGIFKNTAEIRFSLTGVSVHVEGDLAWVTCTENILSQVRGNISVTSALATNLYERRGEAWLLIHHHASHILAPEAPREPDDRAP
jgi:ketosteroid isomerase-like protein